MKVIAKYLPVEGKNEDYCVITNIGLKLELCKEDCDKSNCENIVTRSTERLFAVTQDIKVGEEFFYERKGEKIEGLICEDEMFATNRIKATNGTNYNELNCYKVLGELSPDSTWVKDGDKINVEENPYELSTGEKMPSSYFVECPTCNTYH